MIQTVPVILIEEIEGWWKSQWEQLENEIEILGL